MPSVIGLGGSGTLTSQEATIFDSSVDVISAGILSGGALFTIKNGTGNAFIRNPVLNGATNYFPMGPGDKQDFIINRAGGIGQLFGKSDANGTTITGGPTGGT